MGHCRFDRCLGCRIGFLKMIVCGFNLIDRSLIQRGFTTQIELERQCFGGVFLIECFFERIGQGAARRFSPARFPAGSRFPCFLNIPCSLGPCRPLQCGIHIPLHREEFHAVFQLGFFRLELHPAFKFGGLGSIEDNRRSIRRLSDPGAVWGVKPLHQSQLTLPHQNPIIGVRLEFIEKSLQLQQGRFMRVLTLGIIHLFIGLRQESQVGIIGLEFYFINEVGSKIGGTALN